MAALFAWLWVIGGVPAAILGEVVRADSPQVARAGRIAFAFLLWVDLLIAAVVLSVGADAPTSPMSRSLWWFTVIAAGIPLALVSGVAVRRGYRGGHRAVLATAVLVTAGLYVVFPLGFVPVTQPKLTGLALWEHEHHLLGLAVLLIPTVILLVDEIGRKREVVALEPAPLATPPTPPDRPSVRSLAAGLPRRAIVGGILFLAVLVWMAGTNAAGLLLGLGIVLACLAVFLWHRHRVQMRSVLRDLRPPAKP
jgi:hypothetical protein